MWTISKLCNFTNCGLYCGAKIDFVDIDVETSNMDVIKLEEKLIESKKKNNLPKLLSPFICWLNQVSKNLDVVKNMVSNN